MGYLDKGATSLLLFAVFISGPGRTARADSFNTSQVCLRGRDRATNVDIDCYTNTTNTSHSVIAVTRVIHGLTPTVDGCDPTAPGTTCCPEPARASRDCVFSSGEELAALRGRCDGLVTCNVALDRATVADRCPTRNGLEFGRYSDFAFVEFTCARADLMSDVCDSATRRQGQTLFLDTNFLHDNRHQSNDTCTCVVNTTVYHSLVFKVLNLELGSDSSGNCTESVSLVEGECGGVLATLDCTHNAQQQDGGAIFRSQSSVVGFELRLAENNTGSMLIEVTASNGAPVEVVCGQSVVQSAQSEAPCVPTTPRHPDVSSPTFNTTTETCLQGLGANSIISLDWTLSCAAGAGPGVMLVDRVFYGLTPEAMGCGVGAPQDTCCPGYDAARDCLFSGEEGLAELREKCDGTSECSPGRALPKADVPAGACPARQGPGGNVTFGRYASFAFAEFTCVNTGLLTDICHAGTTVRHSEVYLESNVYHGNREHSNVTCACHASARCGQSLLFHLLDLRPPTSRTPCSGEEVEIRDGGVNGSHYSAVINCSSPEVEAALRQPGRDGAALFESHTNLALFHLRIRGNHTARVFLRVTASDGSEVEVRCGRTTELDVWADHACRVPTTPTPVTSSPPATAPVTSVPPTTASVTSAPPPNPTSRETTAAVALTTTASANTTAAAVSDGNNNDDSNNNTNNSTISTGVAIGVGIVAFLAVILIICLIVVLWRHKRHHDDRDDGHYIVQYVGPDPEPLVFINQGADRDVTPTYVNVPHATTDVLQEKRMYDNGAVAAGGVVVALDDTKHVYATRVELQADGDYDKPVFPSEHPVYSTINEERVYDDVGFPAPPGYEDSLDVDNEGAVGGLSRYDNDNSLNWNRHQEKD